ncbi:MAG: IS481 family transposase [Candidatus Dormiibacterota bacterium]
MHCHRNASLTPRGRAKIFVAVEAGMTVSAACMAFGISRRCYYRWLPRWRAAGELGVFDLSSRPHRSPQQLPEQQALQIAALRTSRGWGPDRIGVWLGLPASTVHRAIRRLGLVAAKVRGVPARRFVYEKPGALLHLDIKKLGRIGVGPGHRATGDKRTQNRIATKGFGWEFLHLAIDDATRLVYCELLPDERAATAGLFLVRALRWFRDQGVQAERILTDNGSAYRARSLRRTCRRLQIRHLFTRPYHPQSNGKAERWIRTALTECLYLEVFSSPAERALALTAFVRYYNDLRPHLGINGLTPRRLLLLRQVA